MSDYCLLASKLKNARINNHAHTLYMHLTNIFTLFDCLHEITKFFICFQEQESHKELLANYTKIEKEVRVGLG